MGADTTSMSSLRYAIITINTVMRMQADGNSRGTAVGRHDLLANTPFGQIEANVCPFFAPEPMPKKISGLWVEPSQIAPFLPYHGSRLPEDRYGRNGSESM